MTIVSLICIAEICMAIDEGSSILLHLNSYEECCTYLRWLGHELHSNQLNITVIKKYVFICNIFRKSECLTKEDELTKGEKIALRKERNHLQMCEWWKQVEYKENEKIQANQYFKREAILMLRIEMESQR